MRRLSSFLNMYWRCGCKCGDQMTVPVGKLDPAKTVTFVECTALNTAEIYDPVAGTFTATGSIEIFCP